jgi:SUN domain-containing protein 1/2
MARTENKSYSLRERSTKNAQLNLNNNATIFKEDDRDESLRLFTKLPHFWSNYKKIVWPISLSHRLVLFCIIIFVGILSSKIRNSNESVHSVDDVKLLIKEALYKYNADKTGLADYALESAGASIITSRCSKSLAYELNTPNLAIQPNVLPGNCWAFEGSKGILAIKLAREIIPTGLSIEHIAESISLTENIDSAIKDFKVKAYKTEYSTEAIILGEFSFNAKSQDYIQYFPIRLEQNSATFNTIELEVLSNHGNQMYTCIYRVRIHGKLNV